jgi:protein-disulfide isomerase
MDRKSNSAFSIPFGPVQIVMVVLLIIGAYLLGSLKAKVDYLQSGQTPVANQPVQQPQVVQPQVTQAAQPQAVKPTPVPAGDVPKVTSSDWVKGNRNSPIAFIEYSDHECPFCKQFHSTAQKVADTYTDKVMWVYRYYPLSFHANAEKEAEASQCAGILGGNDAFWKYSDAIYERTTSNGTGFALTALAPLAIEIGLDEAKFKDCLDSGKMAQIVKDSTDGGMKAGVNGTPGTIILNVKTGESHLLPGAVPFDQIKSIIDDMLKKV